MAYIKTKHILPPGGDENEIIKFWWNEEKHKMTRAEAEAFLEVETKKAPIQAKDMQKELKLRDAKIEELEAMINKILLDNEAAKAEAEAAKAEAAKGKK